VSVPKFIEANQRLSPLPAVSEDNLPNPAPGAYVPRNSPAIGNLMTMFDFGHSGFATLQLPG
jgi:phospholipase C